MRALRWLAVVAVALSWSTTTFAAGEPVVRDHRSSSGVVVRDHRTTSQGPIIRDHRRPYVVPAPSNVTVPSKVKPPVECDPHGPIGPVVPTGPIIRDHRTPTGPIIRDHRTPDASKAPGGVVVTPSKTTRRPTARPSQPKILLPDFPIKIRL